MYFHDGKLQESRNIQLTNLRHQWMMHFMGSQASRNSQMVNSGGGLRVH